MCPCKSFICNDQEQSANENTKNDFAAAIETHADKGFSRRRCHEDYRRGPRTELYRRVSPGEGRANRNSKGNFPGYVEAQLRHG